MFSLFLSQIFHRKWIEILWFLYVGFVSYDFTEIIEFFGIVIRMFYIADHVICRQRRFSFFLIWMPFIFFSCLIALVNTSNIILNRNGKNGHSWLIPDLRGKPSNISPLSVILTVVWLLLCWCTFLFYSLCWKFLSWKHVEFLLNHFFCICRNNMILNFHCVKSHLLICRCWTIPAPWG